MTVRQRQPPAALRASTMRPIVSVDSFRDDPMFPMVERAVAAVLAGGKIVAPVDVIVRIGWLSAADLEAWRFGRVPYLERVIRCNLTRLSRFLRILGFHCHDLNLSASQTAYVKWGKGKRTPLRFTKTNEARLEKIYARHFVWPGKGPFHPPRPRRDPRTPADPPVDSIKPPEEEPAGTITRMSDA